MDAILNWYFSQKCKFC